MWNPVSSPSSSSPSPLASLDHHTHHLFRISTDPGELAKAEQYQHQGLFLGNFSFLRQRQTSVHTHLITLALFHICSFGGIMKLPILGVSAQLQCRRRICECNADLAEAWIRLQQPKSARYGVLLLKPTSLGLICFTQETRGFQPWNMFLFKSLWLASWV